MVWLWAGIRWIHLVAAMLWVGGQLFLVLVLQPVLRRSLPPTERVALVATIGRRYGQISWGTLTLLVITGFLNGVHRHIDWAALPRAHSPYAHTLLAKLGFVIVVVGLSILHGQVIGPRLTQSRPLAGGDINNRRLLRLSLIVTTANLVANLLIVLLSARLVS